MNSEQIKTEAAEAMTLFQRTHSEGCYLTIENSRVVAKPIKGSTDLSIFNLTISKTQLINGLTAGHWTALGIALYRLYTKESECQTHQKH